MITSAIVKKTQIDKDHQRLEVFSPKYPSGQPLAYLAVSYDGRAIKFITGWEDVIGKKRPFKLNDGLISDTLIGNSTIIRGMTIETSDDNTLYMVMDPSLL